MSDLGKDFQSAMNAPREVSGSRPTGAQRFKAEISEEFSRLITHGASEFASALLGNGAYVQYGAGQRREEPNYELKIEPDPAISQDRGGMER